MTDTVTSRIGVARQLLDSRVAPLAATAVPAGRKAAEQVRQVVEEKIVPMASIAVDNARVASAPVRIEAARRGRLAAAALRGADTVVVKKRRRWPVALFFLAVGSAAGAIGAWLTQAGKPVQLNPYPLSDSSPETHSSQNGGQSASASGMVPEGSSSEAPEETVDLTDEARAHHSG